jgi:hypothetical protein
MRELVRPTGIAGDENATEMIRYWLAHKENHISLLLGMWADAKDCDVDELYAWGNVLADIAQHIANGFEQSHGWKYEESMQKLVTHFAQCAKDRSPNLSGSYLEDKQ